MSCLNKQKPVKYAYIEAVSVRKRPHGLETCLDTGSHRHDSRIRTHCGNDTLGPGPRGLTLFAYLNVLCFIVYRKLLFLCHESSLTFDTRLLDGVCFALDILLIENVLFIRIYFIFMEEQQCQGSEKSFYLDRN